MLTIQASPDEDPMSLKYVWRLSAPERPVLTRIAKDRCGRQRPAMGQVERARALLKCDAEPEGVAVPPAGPRDEAQRLQWAQSAPPAGQARGTVADAGSRAGVAGDCAPHQLRDGALRAKKRTDALASGATRLSAGTRVGLRGPDGSGAGPTLRCALSGDQQGQPDLSILTR